MTIRCSNGHDSASEDYCDQCGIRLVTGGRDDATGATATLPDPIACPGCGTSAEKGGRYCEECGADLHEPVVRQAVRTPRGSAGESHPSTRWEVVATCDQAYFEQVVADGIDFPSSVLDRTFPLTGDQMTIGRRGIAGTDVPQIDLSDPPIDTGVSRRHALLTRQRDGTWALTDCQSTNGTYLNDSPDALPPGQAVALAAGDRIHLGAWTTITLRCVPPGGGDHLQDRSRS